MFLPLADGPPLKVGICRTNSIGDVVLGTACIDLLQKLNVNHEITWVGKGSSLTLLEKTHGECGFVDIEKSKDFSRNSKVIEALSKVHFMIDLQGSIRTHLLCRSLKRFFNIPSYTYGKSQLFRAQLIGEARVFGRQRVLPDKAVDCSRKQYLWMTDALREGLRKQLPEESIDGLDRIDARPTLPISASSVASLGNSPWYKELRYGGCSFLAIAPGGSFETKRAPLEVFESILSTVRRTLKHTRALETGLGIVVVGDAADRSFGTKLLDNLAWEFPFINLAGKLSLWESALAIEASTGLLTNDSGLAHIAEAVGTPTSVLFGPTIESFGFSPQLAASKAFSSRIGCRPCSKHGKVPCRFEDHQCFRQISAREVSEHIVSLLRSAVPPTETETETETETIAQFSTDAVHPDGTGR